jgi:hypothetical protein
MDVRLTIYVLSFKGHGPNEMGMAAWSGQAYHDRETKLYSLTKRRRNMKKMISFIMIILFSLAAAASADTFSQTSTKGFFKLEMSIPGKSLQVGKNSAEILVQDQNGKEVKGARITALPFIYQHGESTLVRPKVAEKAKGHYLIEDIYIEMPGHWVLKITIREGNKEDSVTFDFPEVKRES